MTSAHAYDGQCDTPEDIASLPPGHWCEVPNSHLRAVEKKPAEWSDWNGSSSPGYDSIQRVMGVYAVINNWNGAAYDSKRDRLLVMGGGHNGYGGNEIYAFEIPSLRWNRLTDPTPFPNRCRQTVNPDGTPISRHTYGGLAYVSKSDKFFVLGGAADCATGGTGVTGTWLFDLRGRESTGSYFPSQWNLKNSEGEPPTKAEDDAVYDEISGKVFYQYGFNPSGMAAYDVETDSWTSLTAEGSKAYSTLVIPGMRRFIVHFGLNLDGYVRWDNLDGQTLRKTIVATTGVKNMERAQNPGAAYDWQSDRIISWSGGTKVYSLDVDRNVWQEHAPAGGNLVDPGPVVSAGGTFGRFAYSKNLNVFVVVDGVDENVFLYRLAPGNGTESDPAPNPPILHPIPRF